MGISRTVERGRLLRPITSVIGRAALAVLCLATSAGVLHAQVPEPVPSILNRVDAQFEDARGNVGSSSAEVSVALDQHAGPELFGASVAQLCGGDTARFAHRLRNAGNIIDRFTIEVTVPAGFTAASYHDLNEDGVRQPGDSVLTDGILLAPGEEAAVVIEVEIDPSPGSTSADVLVGARSEFDPAQVAETTDVIELCGLALLGLELAVDRTDAVPGDTLEYTITIANSGESASGAITVTDTLPDGLELIGSEADDAVTSEGVMSAPGVRAILSFGYDSLPAGETRVARIRALVAVADTMIDELRNVAVLAHGTDTLASQTVVTELHYARIAVSKQLRNGTTFHEGETAEFLLGWANTSDAALRNAVLVDSLPEGLTYLSASPNPDRIDGRVIEWDIGTLDPGAEGTIVLRAAVDDLDEIGVESLINRVTLSGGAGAAFATAAAAAAAALDVRRFAGEELVVRKRVGALEASAGDAVLWTIEVENIGTLPLLDVVVSDLLPRTLSLVPGSIEGVDSVTSARGETRFHLEGALQPGEVRTVRYRTVVLGGRGTIENLATATAEAGFVLADTSAARLRVREGPAAPARTLLGRVWLDVNDNRIQEAGEPGVAGVDVWTADGVVVRTDEHGRFSLQDLEPGVLALRVDTVGVGGLYRLPPDERVSDVRMNGWTAGRASIRLIPAPQPDPSLEDHVGPPIGPLAPPRGSGSSGSIARESDGDSSRAAGVSIAPLRSVEERAAERRRELTQGPGVTFIAPADGAVFAQGRIYIGARGEPGAPIRLFDGDSLLAEGELRPDGVHDFVAVALEPGTHRLRLDMRNSWGNARADSIVVHRSGDPQLLDVVRETIVLRAESHDRRSVSARVLDEWGVPVTSRPHVTVATSNLQIETPDADAGSVGHQVRTDADGWVRVAVRAGSAVGPANVAFMLPTDSASARVDVMAPVRPLIITGSGRIGIGATEAARAAITARGAIDEETSLTLSFDSRSAQDESFRRQHDALDESFYPVTGDNSERRVLSGSTQRFTARVERGLDWLALGDVRTEGFADADQLASYDRSVDGVAARIGTGDVVWHAFGSSTSETLAREQLRGNGTSGPFRLGADIRPGTDRLALEVRARDNAARVIGRTELDRNLDYQIDYATGEVLLERPLPSTDPNGNPIYLVADIERRGAEHALLGGVRADIDVASLARIELVDSLALGVTAIRDGSDEPGSAAIDLTAANLGVRAGGVDGTLELVHGASADSSALALRLGAGWDVRDDVRLEAQWLTVDTGFAAGANPRLQAGVQELRIGARMQARAGTLLALEHERQSFDEVGVERSATYLRVDQALGERDLSVQTGVVGNGGAGGHGSVLSSRATLRTSDQDEVWLEANRALGADTSSLAPSHLGVGASQRLFQGVRMIGGHRQVWVADETYAQSNVTLRLEPVQDGAVWGGVQRTDGEGPRGEPAHSASFGWSQRLRLDGGWSVSGLYERRLDIGDAPLVDPVRALPFARREADYWSAALGAEWRGLGRRVSGHGELHDGDLASGYRVEATGDIEVGTDFALLTRHDWLLERRQDARGLVTDRRDRSLLGLAFRPAATDELNALARLEWRRSDAPDAADVLRGTSFRRLIGTLDVVWAPRPALEAAFRYAVRGNAFAQDGLSADANAASSHHLGATVDHRLPLLSVAGRTIEHLRGRVDTRLLYSPTVSTARWSLAPSLVYELGSALELEAGWRFGDLEDIDFARMGASGGFASVQLSFTEEDAASIAGFWRERLNR